MTQSNRGGVGFKERWHLTSYSPLTHHLHLVDIWRFFQMIFESLESRHLMIILPSLDQTSIAFLQMKQTHLLTGRMMSEVGWRSSYSRFPCAQSLVSLILTNFFTIYSLMTSASEGLWSEPRPDFLTFGCRSFAVHLFPGLLRLLHLQK